MTNQTPASEFPAFDVLLTGGRVIDPRHGHDGIADIGIAAGRIAAVGPDLPRDGAGHIEDVSGLLVVPGLIDLHTHVYHKATSLGVDPEPIARRSAVSTLVDAGSAGAGNFAGLRDFVIDSAGVRILAYLNISFAGIYGFDKGVSVGEVVQRGLLNVDRCVETIEANRGLIVGVKVRLGGIVSEGIDIEGLDLALQAAERTGLPVMTHIGPPPPSYEEILERMRPGDVLTHCYRPAPNAPVDDAGAVLPALRRARERGILFDIGHGMGAFAFDSAEAALAEGFAPDIISSDVHVLSVNGPAYDLLHTMSKLVTCGLPVPDAVRMATDAPAQAMRRSDLGHLGPGATADITLLDLVEARFPFVDVVGVRRESYTLLRPRGLYVAGERRSLAPRPFEEAYYSA